MNAQLTRSPFLDYLYKLAEKEKQIHDKKITTSNLMLYVAVGFFTDIFVSGDFTATEKDNEEIQNLKTLISEKTRAFELKYKLFELLLTKETYMDDINFRQRVVAAEKEAKEKSLGVLTADLLFEQIFEYPTLEIKSIMNSTDSYDIDKFTKPKASKNADESLKSEDEKLNENTAITDGKAFLNEQTVTAKLLQKQLSSVVFGQDNAINIFSSGYFQAQLQQITDKSRKKPKATYLFAGPPGVGKTFLAEQIAGLLEIPYKRFDMSEYADADAIIELCGTNPSYKEAKEGVLTGFVKKNPECVLLFDEVEKAHIKAIHLFLQLLDAGRLRDTNTDKEVDFSKTIAIFTTNAGRKIYENSNTYNLSGVSRKTILKALETDVDPKTGLGSFPAAICSRFATGNVIMFNHMEAHSLRAIAEKELKKCVANIETDANIKFSIDSNVYSCLLFSEGGHADARTVTSRSRTFFSTEIYELLRLISSEKTQYDISSIEEIKLSITLPEDDPQVLSLFKNELEMNILAFAENEITEKIKENCKDYNIIVANTFEQAKDIITNDDVSLVLCDLNVGKVNDIATLNIEDIDSQGRDLFKYVSDNTNLPLYIICDEGIAYSEEENFSFAKKGARGVIDISDTNNLNDAIADISIQIHQQESMISLARANKIAVYETAQTLSEDGKIAEINIFDIKLETAVDAEDTNNILSNMSKPNKRFDDVIGAKDAKEELKFFVDYLLNPKSFAKKGLGIPKGVLFYGPPGTGKTLLAKAMAGESNVTFITAEGNQFRKKYVGEGEETVHELFATARKYAPTILFVDEIDAIAKERRGGDESSTESILTAFLAEMDGFKTDPKKPVFVLAATNFDVEPGTPKSLDPAMVRRFDRSIYIDLPDKEDRIRFMKMKIEKNKAFNLSEDEIKNIAVRSTGMSLANLENVFEFSLRLAIRNNKDKVDDEIFEEAFEEFNFGKEKKWEASELERTARHEAGHALLCWLSGEKPSYLTIVARGNHGGYMQHDSNEKIGSYSKKMLLDKIRTALGGRAAELVYYGNEDGLTTGASGDLQQATNIAKRIVCNFGMDDTMGLACVTEKEALNGEIANEVRRVVNSILQEEMKNAIAAIEKYKNAIDALVEALMQKDHLGTNEIDEVLKSNIVE